MKSKAKASDQMQKIIDLLCDDSMTVNEVARKINLSSQLAGHYIRELRDLGCLEICATRKIQGNNSIANVWTCINKIERPKKIEVEKPKRFPSGMVLLTRWVGGNPFEGMKS